MPEFIKVKCGNCNNEQIINKKASTQVKCLICGDTLAAPTGGKAKVTAEIIESLE